MCLSVEHTAERLEQTIPQEPHIRRGGARCRRLVNTMEWSLRRCGLPQNHYCISRLISCAAETQRPSCGIKFLANETRRRRLATLHADLSVFHGPVSSVCLSLNKLGVIHHHHPGWQLVHASSLKDVSSTAWHNRVFRIRSFQSVSETKQNTTLTDL